jgi:D-alanine-D-alanine ligase
MIKKNVAIVAGGFSSEYEISLKSAEQVAANLNTTKYKFFIVEITKTAWHAIEGSNRFPINKSDFSFQYGNEILKFDSVFIAIHGNPGENGILQSYFELLNIPFTSCNSFVSHLTFNKYATKAYLQEAGILCAEGMLMRLGMKIDDAKIIKQIGLPAFVKPNNGGSSFGISKITEEHQITPAINKAFQEDSEVLIESFLPGREFSHGILKINNDFLDLPVTEIKSHTEFFDYEAKYKGLSDEITPADLSEALIKQLKEKSKRIYDLLGCKGMIRIDYILGDDQQFYLLEINTVPGMSKESIIPQQIRYAGYTEESIYEMLIEESLKKA